ncbi:MAG TPA: methyltransferase domain-containing protein, partial [Thermomicrobiales bacterium]|nr:methyltransferase domain-containing protein [Thermomicrobiales bacterium]
PSSVLVRAMTFNVQEAGLTNVEIVQGSAGTLPFPDATFDAATCHFSAMFFTDLTGDLAKIRRVLQPGARAAFAGWGPIKDNTHLGPFVDILARHLGPRPLPENPREAPWPMRFAEAGTLTAALEAAGYVDVQEEQPVVTMTWPGPPETLLTFWMELTNLGPEVPSEIRTSIEEDILAHLHTVEDSQGLHFTARVTVGSGSAAA